MRKVGSKILSWLLTVVIVLGLMPMNAYAAETDGHANHKVCVNAEAHAGDGECTHEIITDWQDLNAKVNSNMYGKITLTSGNYYLSGNCSHSYDIEVAAEQDVVICLNGYELDPYDLTLEADATIKICDCSDLKTGVIVSGIYGYDENWLAELYSGTIEGIVSEWPLKNSFNMYGGMLTGDGLFFSDVSDDGVAAYINIYGGKIDATTGILVENTTVDSVVNIYGGTITGDQYDGIGIDITGAGTLNMSGGKIDSIDMGIYAGDNKINISGNAEIRGTSCGIVLGDGSDSKGSKLTITGSPTISCSSEYGEYAIKAYDTINIQDSPTITGGVYSGVYRNSTESYPVFKLTKALTITNPILVPTVNPNFVVTEGWDTYMPGKTSADEILKYFNNEEGSQYQLKYKETDGEIVAVKAMNININDFYEKTNIDTTKEIKLIAGLSYLITEINVYSDAAYQTVSDLAIGKFVSRTISIAGIDDSVLQAGTYYMEIKADGYEDTRLTVVVKDPTTDPIVFTYGNIINNTGNLTGATLETDEFYSSNYTAKVYDSLEATEVSQDVEVTVSGYEFYIGGLDGRKLQAGTYYVTVTYSGKAESTRVPVYVKGIGDSGTIEILDDGVSFDDIAYGDESFEIQASVPEGIGDAEWTWESSDSNLVSVTPDENDSSKATVTILGVTTGVTITATYISDFYTGTATQIIEVDKRDVVITLDSEDYKISARDARVPEFGEYSVSGLLDGHELYTYYAKIVLENGYETGDYLNVGQQYKIVAVENLEVYDANNNITAYYNFLVEEGAYVTVEALGAPSLSELPVLTSPRKGVLRVENNTDDTMYWGIKIVKVEGTNETLVVDWGKCELENNSSTYNYEELAPFEGGTYKVYFCYEEAMVEIPNTGRYTVPAGSATAVPLDIETPGTAPGNSEEDDTCVLDYAYSTYGEIYVSPSVDNAYETMAKAYSGMLDADDLENLRARFFTYDEETWYELPENKEIVITNLNPSEVEAKYLSAYNAPVYNFEATLKAVSIGRVQLGYGDVVLTIDGDVSTGSISHAGNLVIKGKEDANDTPSYAAGMIKVEYGFDPTTSSGTSGGNLTIVGIDNVSLGTNDVEYAVYVAKDITIKDCGVVSVEQDDYDYAAIYTSNGNVLIDNVDKLSINAAGMGIYAECEEGESSYFPVYEDAKVTIQNVDELDINTEGEAVYAYSDIKLTNVGKTTISSYYGIIAEYGDVYINGGNEFDLETYRIGIMGLNIYVQDVKECFEIASSSSGIVTLNYYYSNYSDTEMPKMGDVFIQDSGNVKISGREVMYMSEDEYTEYVPVYDAIGGSEIKIENVKSFTIDNAYYGITAIPALLLMSATEEPSLGQVTISNAGDIKFNIIEYAIKAESNITISGATDCEDTIYIEKLDGEEDAYFAIWANSGDVKVENYDAFVVKNIAAIQTGDSVEYSSALGGDVVLQNIKNIIVDTSESDCECPAIYASVRVAYEDVEGTNKGNIIISNVEKLDIKAIRGIYAMNGLQILNVDLVSVNTMSAVSVLNGDVLFKDIDKMCIVGEYEGVCAGGNVKFENVLGSVTNLGDWGAVCSYAGQIYVSHEAIEKLAVMSGENELSALRLAIDENNTIDSEYVGSYFEIKEYIFSLEALVDFVKSVLEGSPAENETTEEQIKAVVNDIVDSTDEDVTVEFLGYNKTKASANGAGSIEVKIKFNYEDETRTLDATLVIPISEYVEDRLAELREAANAIPGYDAVNGDDEAAINAALVIAEELMENYVQYLSNTEVQEVSDIKNILSNKLEIITVVREKVAEFKSACAEIPSKENVTVEDKDVIIEMLEAADILLGLDANLTDVQKADLATLKAELEEKLAYINKVLADLEDLMVAEEALPVLEEITKEDKEAVATVLNEISKFESAYPGNLTDEQKTVVAGLKESVEARMDKIDADIVAIIEKVVKDTLASITEVTNDSDVKAKVEAAVAAAIAADPTLKGVTVTYDITKVNATTDAEGSIKGKVVITSGDATKEVAVSIVIEKLPVPVHQHDFIWVIVKDATDTETGKMEGTCACGESQSKEIPATAGDDASGKVTVESDEDNDFKAQLTDNEDVKGKIELTQDEQDAIIGGQDLEIILKLEDTTVEVDTAEKEDIAEKLAEKEFEGKKLGTFLDINLIKKIGNTETKIEKTNGMIKLTFEVPASLINKDAAINRTYTIVRNHEGKIEFLKAEFDKETNQLTFETDKFSTYAVIYEDTAVVPEAPKTGDATNFMPILALLFAGFGMVVVGKKKRA